MEINGKTYPLWEQFVEKEKEFIGGTLQDFGDSFDRQIGMAKPDGMSTKITGVKLEPNGEESAYFSVIGEGFTCGFDVQHGGIGAGEEGWLTFSGYGGHTWRIKKDGM